MATIRNREDLQRWLNVRPKEKRSLEAAALSLRAAQRVLPLVFLKADDKISDKSLKWLLRVVSASAFVVNWPSFQPEVAPFIFDVERAFSDDYSSANTVVAAAIDATIGAAASAARSADAAYDATDVVNQAVDAAHYAAGAAAFASVSRYVRGAAGAAGVAAYAELWVDALVFEDGESVASVLSQPLFSADALRAQMQPRIERFFATLHQEIEGEPVWIDWYEKLLRGHRFSEAEAGAYVFLEGADWDTSSLSEINAAIRKKLESLKPPKPLLAREDRDFFISYNSKDEVFAKEVNDILEGSGFTTVVQYRDFPNGNFVVEMDKGMARSKRMIAVLTENYVVSDPCHSEWAYFYNRDTSSSSRTIVQLLFEEANLRPLQQQVVYSNLIAKSRSERRAIIVEAVTHKPKTYSSDEAVKALESTASPDVRQRKTGELDSAQHPDLDMPRRDKGIEIDIDMLLGLLRTLQNSVSDQAPRAAKESLSTYEAHLQQYRTKAIIGLLSSLWLAVSASKRDADPDDWGNGVLSLLTSFENAHLKFISYFDRVSERERVHSEVRINTAAVTEGNLSAPLRNAIKSIQDYPGDVTDELKADFKALKEAVEAVISADVSKVGEDPGLLTPIKSVTATAIGSMERFYNLAGSTASIVSTPQGQALLASVEKALSVIKKLIIGG